MLRRRVLHQNDILCVVGCSYSETAVHLFLDCDIFATTWYFVWRWLGIDFVPSGGIGDHFHYFSQLADMPCSSHLFIKLIWIACVWAIWKERNNRIFKNVASDPCALLDKVKLNIYVYVAKS